MLYIINHNTNPYFNIASEEYLLKAFDDDIFMLYRNEPSVIVGKHQNAFAEVNTLFVTNNDIQVIRRLSGGGAVFHDPGNVNFTFISNGKEGHLVDFRRFLNPIVQSLQKMGVNAEANSRNDITINGLKVSGNAEHVFKNRTLHHGTLLYASKMEALRGSLNVNASQFQDKAVRSVRSSVTNISDYLTPPLSVADFMEKIQQSVLGNFQQPGFYNFSPSDTEQINQLVETKYATWQWNYGYSPKCRVLKSATINSIEIQCELVIDKGIIAEIDLNTDPTDTKSITTALMNSIFEYNQLKEKLAFLPAADLEAWLKMLFGRGDGDWLVAG